MTKWTKTRRDPGRTYLDEERLQRTRRMLARVHELVESGIEAEPEVVQAAKAANPEITEEQLKEVITLFRDAVYSRQHGR
jgi:type II secretory pathway component PulM